MTFIPVAKRSIANECLLAAGLGFIGYTAITYSDKLVYPTTTALLPCVGAALAIYAGSAHYTGLLLRNAIAARIGRVSYSLYLLHWPIIVFARLCLYRPLTSFDFVIAAATTYFLAEIMYRYIEQPFRSRQASARYTPYAAIGAAAMTLTFLLAYLADNEKGWTWRIDPDLILVATETRFSNPEILGPLGCEGPCEFGNPNGSKVLIVGDSHIDQYTKTLASLGGDRYHFYLAYGASCYFGAKMTVRLGPYLRERCEAAHAQLRNGYERIPFKL